MDTKPPVSLPSLKLMEAANRLLGEANAMDSSEIFTLIDSFPEADPEQQWEIVGVMFLRVIFHPNIEAEAVYEQLKKLLIVANTKP